MQARSWLLVFAMTILGPWAMAAQPNPGKVAREVDRLIAEELFGESPELAPRTGDATYLRRVWLDVVGDIPSPEHVTAFLLDPAGDKRERVVRDLLASEQFGQNWARYWRDVVFFRRLEDRALLASNAMVTMLTEELNRGTSWDAIAVKFITSQGDVRDNGAAAIYMAQDGRTEESTAEMARIFLGIQIQCAQCHDHPYDRWKREEFHELAAFFPRVGLQPVNTPTRRSFAVVANDRPDRPRRNPNQGNRGKAEHYMPNLDDPAAPGTQMEPRFFLTNEEIPLGTPDAERRGTIAEWMTESEWFATAYVNRIWAEMVGEGFYEPIDDLGPDRTPSAPKGVAYLSKQFVRSGHDPKWLVEVICRTEAYQRECRPRRAPNGVPFVANVAQRLRGDQLFNALLTTLELDEESMRALVSADGAGRGVYGQRGSPRAAFEVVFGYDPSEPRETVTASIPQVLAMMNTPQLNRALSSGRRLRPTAIDKLIREIKDDGELITELYLRTLCRAPSSDERAYVADYVKSVGDRTEAFEDLLWMLINSSEYVHRK